MLMATAIHCVCYFGMFGLFEFLERFKLLRHYKLARTAGQEPTWAMKSKTLIEFSVSQFLNLFALGPGIYRVLQKRGTWMGTDGLPPAWTMFKQFAIATFVNRVGFYLVHRLVHHGPFYRAIHKKQ